MTFEFTSTEVVPEKPRVGAAKAKSAEKRNGELSGPIEKRHDELSGPIVPSSMRGRKRLARIMEAAAELFLREGYFATSIEAVLEASGGSKATLYSYFSTKDDLFRAVIEEAILTEAQPKLDVRGDVKSNLTEYVVKTFEFMSSPRHRALLRLTIAERERFPDLARRYYESGPLHSRRMLTQFFKELEQQRVLQPGTSEDAADYFVGLITHQWLLESLLFGDDRLTPAEVVRGRAAASVERFLASARR